MAQMTVPAEPSYKTTSYNGLKGADFSNDPSLVAKNHSPDLLNMISDDGGSPIKRKGWEVTDSVSSTKSTNIWHFQMFGKIWHIAVFQDNSKTYVYAFNDDGELFTPAHGSLNWTGTVTGFFFNSADESKTGFYILANDMYKIRPATALSTNLTWSTVSPTVPVARELTNFRGEGGITYGLNLLTRQATFKFYDGRATTFTPRKYFIFPEGSPLEIASSNGVVSVRLLQTDGTWYTCSSSEYERVDGRTVRLKIDHFVSDTTTNVTEITIKIAEANAGENKGKICNCTCTTNYSQMTEGQVFVSGNPDYPQYVWYSDVADPTYFPDINYLFVGGAGTQVKGMIPFGSDIAVLKEPSTTESTIFLLDYTTATDQHLDVNGETYTTTRDVYQVKHGFTGVGSLSSDTVLSLGDEPLFLSQNGIMGMVSNAINSSNSVKNRSDFLDPRLLLETNLENAVATVHKGYYILVVNGHAYILDSRQKSADYRGNTSYLYESYYWNNIPATAIASDGERLWFGTADGELCRFKETGKMADYSDNSKYGDEPIRTYIAYGETALSSTWLLDSNGDAITPDNTKVYIIMGSETEDGELVPDTGTYDRYTVYSWTGSAYQEEYTQIPIEAIWSTPLDNDGATQYFKTLQKKGSGCTLYPFTRSSVDAYLEKDGQGEVYVGSTTIDIDNWEDIDFDRFTFIANKAPRDLFFRKKMKKYKRLKIILKNDELDEGFGVQEIFKTYLMTRYAK